MLGTPGRDHWGNAMFCLMGGGGVQGGRIVGSTNRLEKFLRIVRSRQQTFTIRCFTFWGLIRTSTSSITADDRLRPWNPVRRFRNCCKFTSILDRHFLFAYHCSLNIGRDFLATTWTRSLSVRSTLPRSVGITQHGRPEASSVQRSFTSSTKSRCIDPCSTSQLPEMSDEDSFSCRLSDMRVYLGRTLVEIEE